MVVTPAVALDRTVRLINLDFFNGELDPELILDSLLGTTVQVAATERDLGSAAGQTALVTLSTLIARLGIGLDLDVAEVGILAPQPPLVGDELRAALCEHAARLVPGTRITTDRGRADLSIGLGVAGRLNNRAAPLSLTLTGDDTSCHLGPSEEVKGEPWSGAAPVGALLGGCAGAAEAFKVALGRIARAAGRPFPMASRRPGQGVISLVLGLQPETNTNLGDVDVISAGAISNAAIFSLLRFPHLRGRLRVFDHDVLDGTNLNRYSLMDLLDIGVQKVTLLERFSSPALQVTGVQQRYDEHVPGIAERVIVGADDIPVRWVAQRRRPNWLGIGATSHTFAVVSTHGPDGPCAGCLHDHDDPDPVDLIPTMSVVSFMAGTILAARLVESAVGARQAGRVTACFPLGLGGAGSWVDSPAAANIRCPVRCAASTRARRTLDS